jgi:hypothetical protein
MMADKELREAHMARRFPILGTIGFIAPFIIASIPIDGTTGVESAGSIQPAMAGSWSRLTFGFEQPASGPGPIGRYSREPNTGGNFNNPILKPEAAAVVKKRGEMLRGGEDYPNPSLNCLPMVSPYVFRVQEMQIIQKKDEVIFLFMQDHQIRRVRLNGTHPAKVTPSWYGDSIGHYEGETLVVDTIGYKLGPAPVLDMFGSPFSEGLHVTERYRLIDYEAARAAQERNIRDAGPVATEQAATIDENYKGKGLQVQFTVEDKNVFNTPWSAAATYRRAASWVENVCAENIHEYYAGKDTVIPKADKPDF